MKTTLSLLLGLGTAASTPAAERFELSAHAGPAFPFYSQQFTYDPGAIVPPLPGITIDQRGAFQLDAKGGLAGGASATWYFAGPIGLEARIDTADVSVDATGARYDVRVDLPSPLPDLSAAVDVGSGSAELERLRPLSLDLKLRTPGRVRLSASAGVSYLPVFRFSVRQTVGLGVTGFDGRRRELDVATLALTAEARPEDSDQGRVGLNGGIALQLPLAGRLRLLLEGRYFHFRQQTLRWRRADDRPLSALDALLLREVERRLEPVEFSPRFFQATAGVALGF